MRGRSIWRHPQLNPPPSMKKMSGVRPVVRMWAQQAAPRTVRVPLNERKISPVFLSSPNLRNLIGRGYVEKPRLHELERHLVLLAAARADAIF
jgi:hypothetical protein